ncbi:MAG TPA: MFS transporter, partial [Solirubrobacteraceae bacterium]
SLTGALSISIAISAAFSAALVVPLEHAFGSWEAALAVWAIPALAAGIPWAVWAHRTEETVTRAERPPRVDWRAAWALPAFFGAQSAAFFAALSWLPSILHHADGISTGRAGLLLAIDSVAQGGPAYIVPVLAVRMESQRPLLLAIVALSVGGVLGLIVAPSIALLWIVLLGFGQGGALGLALILPLLRGGDAEAAAGLTALALSGGYLISAMGPWVVGLARDVSGGWTAPLVVLLAITLSQLPAGLPAVRPGILSARSRP